MDMLRWAMGKESPRAVTAIGGRWAGIKDNREIPDTMEVIWEYDDAMMVFCQYNANAAGSSAVPAEMELRGTKGTMFIHYDSWQVVPEEVATVPFGARIPTDRSVERAWAKSKKTLIEAKAAKGSIHTAPHTRNFLDCVKSRAKCNCDVLTGHISTSATLIGNIAHKKRSLLEWDARAERFTNNAEANRMLQYEYRAPYKLG
jgi:predicted dehydrogenase